MAFTPQIGQPVEAGTTFQPKIGTSISAAPKQGIMSRTYDPQPGLIQGLAQSVASPFLKATTSLINPLAATFMLLSGQGAAKAQKRLTEQQDYGYFGKARPIDYNQQTGERLDFANSVKQIAGSGVEIGSYTMGAPAVKAAGQSVFKLAVRESFKHGAKAGAIIGSTSAVGVSLQERERLYNDVFDNIVIDGVKGGVAGAIIGGVTSAAIPMIGRAIRGTGKFVSAVQTLGEKVSKSATAARLEREALKFASPARQEASRVGIDLTVSDFITNLEGKDALAAREMLDIAKAKMANIRVQAQPKEVVGRTVLDRVNYIIDTRREVGALKGQFVADNANAVLDVTEIYQGLTDQMARRGVYIKADGTLRSTGAVVDADLKYYQLLVDLMRPNEEGKVLRTVGRIDEIRQRTFNEFDVAARAQEPFSSDISRTVGDLRSSLEKSISTLDPQYGEWVTKYAKMSSSLEEFTKLIQYKGRLDDLTTKELKTAEVAMRVLGNASDRPLSVINNLEKTAGEAGYKATDNIYDQILMSDILEDITGTGQRRSFKGEITRAGQAVYSDIVSDVEDMSTLNVRNFIRRKVRALLGTGTDEQVRAVEALLYENNLSPELLPADTRAFLTTFEAAGEQRLRPECVKYFMENATKHPEYPPVRGNFGETIEDAASFYLMADKNTMLGGYQHIGLQRPDGTLLDNFTSNSRNLPKGRFFSEEQIKNWLKSKGLLQEETFGAVPVKPLTTEATLDEK